MRWLTLVWIGCGKSDGGPSDTNDTATAPTTPPQPPTSDFAFDPSTNFTFAASYTGPHAVVSSQSDFGIDWSGLATDQLGRPMTEVGLVVMQARTETQAEVLSAVATGGPSTEDALDYWYFEPGGRTLMLASELSQTGNFFDPAGWVVVGTTTTFVVQLKDAAFRTLAVGTLAPGGAEDGLTFDAVSLDADVALSGGFFTTTTALGPWTFDWSGLTTDALGGAVDPIAIDQLFLARYPLSPAELPARVLDPEGQADPFVIKYVSGRSSLASDEITGFTGFEVGSWLIGLRCLDCPSPVPAYTVRLEVL